MQMTSRRRPAAITIQVFTVTRLFAIQLYACIAWKRRHRGRRRSAAGKLPIQAPAFG